MKSEWNELTIDELKANKKHAISMGPFGSNIKAENFVTVGIPVIKGTNLNGDFINENKYDFLTEEKANSLMASNAYPLDLVITHRGTIGQVGLIPINSKYKRYVVSQSQLKVSLDTNKINPYYAYYFFKSNIGQHRLLVNSSQVGVPAIAQASTSVKKILLPHPSIESQNKIVQILLTLDDKIELNRKMNQTLEEMAQALFKSWFVDFDPVHIKAKCSSDEELESAAKELGISKEILELFPSEFEESELGMIPKGWEVQELSSITEILNGHAFKSGDYTKEGTFVLRTKNFSNDGYVENANDDVYLPSSFLESHSKFICEPYDFHLVMVGASIGKTSMILPINLPALRNQNMWCFRPKEGFVSKVFINALVKNVVKIQMGFANGSAREFFTKGSFFNQEVLVPVEKVLESYDMLTMQLLEKINNNQAQIQTLQKTRDTLLPKLLSGELDVSELDLD